MPAWRSRYLPAVLDAIVPGLGHLVAGRRKLASLDPVTKTVSMISVPRDMVNVPLPDGRQFKGKINRSTRLPATTRSSFRGRTEPATTC
jgi:hypothetical protein